MAMDYLFISPYRYPNFNNTLCSGLNETCGLNFDEMRKVLLPTDCHQFVSNVQYLDKTIDCSKLFVKKNHPGSCFVINGAFQKFGIKNKEPLLTFNRKDFQKQVALKMDLLNFNGAQLHVSFMI